MFMLLEDACKVFSVPQPYLYDSAKRIAGTVVTKNNKRWVHFDNAGKSLGLGVDILREMHAGREWLMAEDDIERIYGEVYHNNAENFKIIAGEPVIDSDVPVYRVSPFIRFTRLTPEERVSFLQGVPHGSRDKAARKTIRRGDRLPHKDNPPRGKRGRSSKRLGS